MNITKTHKTSADWLAYGQEQTFSQTGSFLTKDACDEPIMLTWEKIDSPSSRLSEIIKEFSEILITTYTQQELEFARQYPHADIIAQEYFLKSLAPLFKNSANVDWGVVEDQIKTILQQFFETTDFAHFSGVGDVHIIIVAKHQTTGKPVGLIQFLSTPNFEYGAVRAGYYGVMPESKECGLEEILMSSIFALLPLTTRIFLHTRATNKHTLEVYARWGFTVFPGQSTNWPDLEYLAKESNLLQKRAMALRS